jgi:phosphate starvation-inducible PhoH-like protein
VLDHVDDIHFAHLTSEDVVRHTLVGRIIDAYTEYDAEQQARQYERDQGGTGEGANRAERRGAMGRGPRDRQQRRGGRA